MAGEFKQYRVSIRKNGKIDHTYIHAASMDKAIENGYTQWLEPGSTDELVGVVDIAAMETDPCDPLRAFRFALKLADDPLEDDHTVVYFIRDWDVGDFSDWPEYIGVDKGTEDA